MCTSASSLTLGVHVHLSRLQVQRGCVHHAGPNSTTIAHAHAHIFTHWNACTVVAWSVCKTMEQELNDFLLAGGIHSATLECLQREDVLSKNTLLPIAKAFWPLLGQWKGVSWVAYSTDKTLGQGQDHRCARLSINVCCLCSVFYCGPVQRKLHQLRVRSCAWCLTHIILKYVKQYDTPSPNLLTMQCAIV